MAIYIISVAICFICSEYLKIPTSERITHEQPKSNQAPSRKKCALPEKTGLSARCRVSGICLSRFAPSHPASAPSPSAFLHAAHFLCQIACWECGPRLSPNWQSVLSFRTNLGAARPSQSYTERVSAQSEPRKSKISSTESPVIFEINSSFNPCKIAFFAASTAFCRAPSSNAICRWCLIS